MAKIYNHLSLSKDKNKIKFIDTSTKAKIAIERRFIVAIESSSWGITIFLYNNIKYIINNSPENRKTLEDFNFINPI